MLSPQLLRMIRGLMSSTDKGEFNTRGCLVLLFVGALIIGGFSKIVALENRGRRAKANKVVDAKIATQNKEWSSFIDELKRNKVSSWKQSDPVYSWVLKLPVKGGSIKKSEKRLFQGSIDWITPLVLKKIIDAFEQEQACHVTYYSYDSRMTPNLGLKRADQYAPRVRVMALPCYNRYCPQPGHPHKDTLKTPK